MADGQMNIRATLDLSDLERKAARYGQAVRQMGVVTDEQGRVMSTAWTRMKQAAGAYLTLDIVKRIAQTRGEFQSLNVAFTTMLGDGAKAQRLMAESVELAAHTPFTLQDVASGAKQLLAYGFAAEEITDTLRRLGDVASALGLPMERLTYLYGTTATQGRLYARDMIQFTTSGVPVLQELAKMYGKTTEEINNMVTAGKIGFDDVKKVFENMTNQGGRFYNLMEETSKTITGKISNLGDAIQKMFNDVGQANEGMINGAIDGAKYLVENYEKVLSILKVLVATYGTYKASLIAVAAAQRVSVTIQNISAWLSLAKTIRTAKDAQIAFNLATKANPYVLLATVIIGVGTALYQFTKKTDAATEALKKFNEESKKNADDTATFITIARDENQSIAARQLALDSLRKMYPGYFDNMDLEALKVINLTELNNQLAKATRERSRAEAEESIKETEKSIDAIKQQIDFLNKNAVQGRGERLIKANKQLQELQDKLAGQHSILNKVNSDIKAQEDAERRAKEEAEAHAKSVEKTVKWYEEQIKTLKEAQEASTTSKQFNDYQKQIDQLTKEKEAITGASKATQKTEEERIKTIEQINEELLSLRKQNQQAQIDLMEEGTEKELAQIRLDYQEKIAEIKKLADKWAAEQGGALTSEQTVQISTAYSSAKQERDSSTTETYQKGLNELLQKYQDYDAKRREIEEKFAKDMQTLESRKTPVNAKQITGAQEELKYQREQALAEIANEFASRSEEFESWMNEIASFSLDKLYETLRAAQAELGKLQVAGKGGKQLAEAQAKVDAIKKEISKKKKDESEGPDNRSIKDWQELYKTLLKVDRQFQEIGDSVGGLAGEIISTAGSIATSTMSMINSIINFSNTSVDTTVITSKVAATAIKTVEKASVILTIISAALEIATKIASLFTGKSKNERDTERLQATTSKLAETNEIINRLIEKRIELINSANAAERKGIEESAQDIIDIQKKRMEQSFQNLLGTELLGKKGKNNDLDVEDLGIRNIDQLKEFLSSKRLLDLEANGYSLTNKDQWEQIIKNWDELNEKAKELENAVKEANTGLTFEDAKDGLDDLLLSADTTFEDISGNFEEYMRNSVLKMVKSRYLNDAMQKWYDNFAERVSDGDLSEEDVNKLQSEYESMYENAQSRIDQMLAAAGLSLEGGEEQTPNAQTGSISETITEQTASEMTGIWRGQYDTLKGIYTVNSSFYESYKSTMAICNGILNQIADNTGRTAENTTVLSGINDTLSRMDGRLKTLESNSNKKYI